MVLQKLYADLLKKYFVIRVGNSWAA